MQSSTPRDELSSSRSIIFPEARNGQDRGDDSLEESQVTVESVDSSYDYGNLQGMGDFKDDKQISKNPVQNSHYNLVE